MGDYLSIICHLSLCLYLSVSPLLYLSAYEINKHFKEILWSASWEICIPDSCCLGPNPNYSYLLQPYTHDYSQEETLTARIHCH